MPLPPDAREFPDPNVVKLRAARWFSRWHSRHRMLTSVGMAHCPQAGRLQRLQYPTAYWSGCRGQRSWRGAYCAYCPYRGVFMCFVRQVRAVGLVDDVDADDDDVL